MLMVQKLTFFGMFFAFERVFPISPVLQSLRIGYSFVLVLSFDTHLVNTLATIGDMPITVVKRFHRLRAS